jgi:hypothetical protein
VISSISGYSQVNGEIIEDPGGSPSRNKSSNNDEWPGRSFKMLRSLMSSAMVARASNVARRQGRSNTMP